MLLVQVPFLGSEILKIHKRLRIQELAGRRFFLTYFTNMTVGYQIM